MIQHQVFPKNIIGFLIPLMFVFFFGLAPGQVKSSKIKIVTTVFPLMEFAEAVCGIKGKVSLLLPPGAEIHTWKPRPSDIVRLASADCFIYIGSNLEPWTHNLLNSVNRSELKILEVGRVLLENKNEHGSLDVKDDSYEHGEHREHTEVDPHIWLDFELDQIIVDKIAVLLSDMDPNNSALYTGNAKIFKDKLQRLHKKYQDGLEECRHRTLILGGHGAFGYLARKYSLNQISLYGLSPDSKPTPKQLVEIVELAKSHGVDFIFFETYVSDDLAKVIAKEIGARTIVLNPGANLTKKQLDSGVSFFDIMEMNLENLRHGLGCQ